MLIKSMSTLNNMDEEASLPTDTTNDQQVHGIDLTDHKLLAVACPTCSVMLRPFKWGNKHFMRDNKIVCEVSCDT